MLINQQLGVYLDSFNTTVSGKLGKIQERAYDEGLPIIPKDVVRLIEVVLLIKKPKRILEIGCGIGFSAAFFTRFLQNGGDVTTIERYSYMEERAVKNIKELELEDKINLIKGDAADILPKLARENQKYDFIFMDCGKSKYLSFLPYCLEMLNKGGLFVADDVLQSGTVAWEQDKIAKRNRTTYRNMKGFISKLLNDKGCAASVLPIGDGLILVVKESAGETIEKN